MGMGLIGIGQQKSNQAQKGFGEVASLENKRNQAEEQLKANYAAAESSQQATMMGAGASVGFMVGGPIGAGIGAAVGFLGASLF
ncbi:Bacteriocin [uncultured Thiomicrorhabdus sp.]